FSSRRRHTRFSRDWSSDVCSSDLKQDNVYIFVGGLIKGGGDVGGRYHFIGIILQILLDHCLQILVVVNAQDGRLAHVKSPYLLRSEERRVGIACSCRVSSARRH